MDLTDMRTIVRRDLHDEDAENSRWTNDELDRHIAHAVKDYSAAMPLEQKASMETTAGSREIDISGLTGRVTVEAVEYPAGEFPARYQRFALWGDTVTLLGDEVPDGSDAVIYYGSLHTLDDASSTIPVQHEDLIAAGSCGYAAIEFAVNTVNRVNAGGPAVPSEFENQGRARLDFFRKELKKFGRKNRVRVRTLYSPYSRPVSKSTDTGP